MARPEKKTPNKNHQILQAAWRNVASKIGRNGSHLQGSDIDKRAAAAKDSYAAALAWAQLAEEYGYGTEIDLRENQKRIEQEARKLKEQIRWSPEFAAVIEETSLSSLLNMAEPQHDQSQQNTEVRPVTQFKEFYDKRVSELGPQIQVRAERLRLRKLIGDLKQSTQKSFAGKLKSWFVGNSEQYKNAYGAMRRLAYDDKLTPEEKDKAKKDIKEYLTLRGKKVRDHQYGRDRFDAFMKGLATVMEPQEFKDYCEEVNQIRSQIDKAGKSKIDPETYKTPEARQKDIIQQAKQRENTEPAKTGPQGIEA